MSAELSVDDAKRGRVYGELAGLCGGGEAGRATLRLEAEGVYRADAFPRPSISRELIVRGQDGGDPTTAPNHSHPNSTSLTGCDRNRN